MKPEIINMDINSMYPSWLGGFNSFDQYREYRRSVEGLWSDNTNISMEEVNKMGEPYLNRYTREDTDRDIHFLFETNTWNGKAIKDMTASHIINAALMLLKRATEFKLNYELFVIDNTDNKLLVPRDNIEDLAKKDATTWVKTTPIFTAFVKELATRKLLNYFNIVLERLENGTED